MGVVNACLVPTFSPDTQSWLRNTDGDLAAGTTLLDITRGHQIQVPATTVLEDRDLSRAGPGRVSRTQLIQISDDILPADDPGIYWNH